MPHLSTIPNPSLIPGHYPVSFPFLGTTQSHSHSWALPSLIPGHYPVSFPFLGTTQSHSRALPSLIPRHYPASFPGTTKPTQPHSQALPSLIPGHYPASFLGTTQLHSRALPSLIPGHYPASFLGTTQPHSRALPSLIPGHYPASFPGTTQLHSQAPPSLIPRHHPASFLGTTQPHSWALPISCSGTTQLFNGSSMENRTMKSWAGLWELGFYLIYDTHSNMTSSGSVSVDAIKILCLSAMSAYSNLEHITSLMCSWFNVAQSCKCTCQVLCFFVFWCVYSTCRTSGGGPVMR